MVAILLVEGKEVQVQNPDKLLWADPPVTKLAYVQYLLSVAPYLLPYTRDRLLMVWRYPDGVGTRKIEEKMVPSYAPAWIPRAPYNGRPWILLNDAATLAWLGNLAALELHVPFDRYTQLDYPTELVFDLDPPGPDQFELVCDVAITLKRTLDSLGLYSIPKTSGATGLQVYVPIKPLYTFAQARRINHFVARYVHDTMPQQVTLERVVAKRGAKLYFDYLQLWKMRTMAAPYSTRARSGAPVSAPVTWAEVEQGFNPSLFNVITMGERLRLVGDLFAAVTTQKDDYSQELGSILAFMDRHEA